MTELRIVDEVTGMTYSQYDIPYGSVLYFKDGASVKKGDLICEWDAYNATTIVESAGTLRFEHMIEGVTYREESADEYSSNKDKVIIEGRDKTKNPSIVILDDGTDIRDVRVKDLRALMGNVNQDPILFNDTIYNNIAFGVEGATEEEVIAAAKIANAHDFIMEKREGYQTNIGDRGSKLSGGQRQRLSIARAILKNPPILILDEATASLDTESERIVQEALDRLMSSRTTIAIAHRLSTIKNADEIIVMHEGQVVERGTHAELIALDGYYKRLNDMQAL